MTAPFAATIQSLKSLRLWRLKSYDFGRKIYDAAFRIQNQQYSILFISESESIVVDFYSKIVALQFEGISTAGSSPKQFLMQSRSIPTQCV